MTSPLTDMTADVYVNVCSPLYDLGCHKTDYTGFSCGRFITMSSSDENLIFTLELMPSRDVGIHLPFLLVCLLQWGLLQLPTTPASRTTNVVTPRHVRGINTSMYNSMIRSTFFGEKKCLRCSSSL